MNLTYISLCENAPVENLFLLSSLYNTFRAVGGSIK
jgi:hypothetical protein